MPMPFTSLLIFMSLLLLRVAAASIGLFRIKSAAHGRPPGGNAMLRKTPQSAAALNGLRRSYSRRLEGYHDPGSRAPTRDTPMPTWPELQTQLQVLREDVPGMLRENPDSADFFEKFAGRAGLILESTPPDLTESVRS